MCVCSSHSKSSGTEYFGYSGFMMSVAFLEVLTRDFKKDRVSTSLHMAPGTEKTPLANGEPLICRVKKIKNKKMETFLPWQLEKKEKDRVKR